MVCGSPRALGTCPSTCGSGSCVNSRADLSHSALPSLGNPENRSRALPRSSQDARRAGRAQLESCLCRCPRACHLISPPHPHPPAHLPGLPAVNLTIIIGGPGGFPLPWSCSRCSLYLDCLHSSGPSRCLQEALPGSSAWKGSLSAPCRPPFKGPTRELHLSSWSSGWAFTPSGPPSFILQMRKLRLISVE